MTRFQLYFGNKRGSAASVGPDVVASDDAFFSPTAAPGSVSLAPSLYDDTDSFYVPVAGTTAALQPGAYTDADAFFSPTASPGAVSMSTPTHTDIDVFWQPVVGAGSVTLLPDLYDDADTLYQPTVSVGGSALSAPLYDDVDTFHQPTVFAGSVALAPSLYDDADTFYQPTVEVAAVSLTPGLVASDDVFYAPVVSAGAIVLQPGVYSDADVFYAPSIAADTVLASPVYVDTDSFYAPALSGSVTVAPSLVSDADSIYAPSVVGQFTLQPPLVVSDALIYTPIDASIYVALAPLLVDADSFYAPAISTSAVSVLPNRYVDSDIFYTPTVQAQTTQGGGGGGNNNVPKNVKYAMSFTLNSSGLIVALQIQSSQAKANINTRMMLYADSAGLPGVLVAQSAVKSGITAGVNVYPLIVPYSVLVGQKIWAAFHTDTNIGVLGNSPAGSRYNTDLFSDGASNPFGVASLDNQKAPILLVILSAVNATMSPPLYVDTDAFYAPAVSKSNAIAPPYLQDTDFFYAATVVDSVYLLPALVVDSDVVHAAQVDAGAVTLQPPLVVDAEETIIPVIGVGDADVKFPAPLASDDQFYEPTVTVMGAELPPDLVDDDDSFYEPAVISVYSLAPSLVPSDDSTEDDVVDAGPVGVNPPHVIDVDEHWISDLLRVGGIANLLPEMVEDGDLFYAPAQSAPRRAHHVTIKGNANRPTVRARSDNDQFVVGTAPRDVALSGRHDGIVLEGDASAVQVELEGNDA